MNMFSTKTNLKIGRLYSGGLMVNYVCSSACGHCLYNCSPKLAKEYITTEMAERIFEKIKSCGCSSVHIGGGEPFLNPEQLIRIAETANKSGISIEYIETNSSWYKDHASACKLLQELQRAGINTLLISMSPFHNEFIPFKKVKGVMTACNETGMQLFPWIADFAPDIAEFDEDTPHSLEEYSERFGNDYLKQLIYRYSLTMRGRTLETFKEVVDHHPTEQVVNQAGKGCDELANISHFHFDLYGNYIPGLCTGLAIHVDDIGSELPENQYPFIRVLYRDGIKGFLKYAIENYDFQPLDKYISKCHICSDIRSHLVNNCEVRTKDLQPVQFYK